MGREDGDRRLLLVDDEPAFGQFVQDAAEPLGFEVLTTTSGREFMAAFADFAATTVVLDVVMPEVEGMELVVWLAKQKYAGRLIVVTGYAPNYARLVSRLAEASGGMTVTSLAKPVALADLEKALTEDPAADD